jgi:hypothetical protein
MQQSKESDSQTSPKRAVIELRVRDVSDLLEASPPPFRAAALTPDAENYIVRQAKQIPAQQSIHLLIKSARPLGINVGPAIIGYFRDAAGTGSQDIREIFRSGRKALLIGLVILSLCLFLAWYFTYHVTQRPITRLIQESFVILGWVSMWKPIEIFLYDWLPIARRRKLFLRLSLADVTSSSSETR